MLEQSEIFTTQEIENNHRVFEERLLKFKEAGIDQIATRAKIMEFVPLNKYVLEIGTGKGYLTKELAKKSHRVISVDMNEKDQHIAKLNAAYDKILDKIEFIHTNAEHINYPDRHFDSVVSAYTFHHLKNPFAVLLEMIRLTSLSLIISDFNKNGFQILNKLHNKEGGTHDEGSGDYSIVGVFLEEHGFEVKKIIDELQIIYVAKRR